MRTAAESQNAAHSQFRAKIAVTGDKRLRFVNNRWTTDQTREDQPDTMVATDGDRVKGCPVLRHQPRPDDGKWAPVAMTSTAARQSANCLRSREQTSTTDAPCPCHIRAVTYRDLRSSAVTQRHWK